MQSSELLVIDRDRLSRRLEIVAEAMLDGLLPKANRLTLSMIGLGDLDSKCVEASRRIAHELTAEDLFVLLREVEIEAAEIRDPAAAQARRHADSGTMLGLRDRIRRIIRDTFQG